MDRLQLPSRWLTATCLILALCGVTMAPMFHGMARTTFVSWEKVDPSKQLTTKGDFGPLRANRIIGPAFA